MARFRSIDPATNDLVWEGEASDSAGCADMVTRARQAQEGWADQPLEARIAVMRTYARLLEQRRDILGALISRETGKPRWEGLAEVTAMIGKVELSIRAQAERAGERRTAMAFGAATLHHRPQGVMLVLGPFNLPGHLPNGHIVPALLAGNAVIFKPSDHTPAVGAAMVAALHDAGVPRDVVIVAQGGRETGAALVEQPIDGLLFTGSALAGRHLRQRLAERPEVIVALELGGNNALIAWDGDPAAIASIIVASAFMTTGQRCSCARRLILPHDRADSIIDAVIALTDRLIVAPWNSEPQPFMGPLISEDAANHARMQISELEAAGGRVVRRLAPIDGSSSAFVQPAIVDVTGVDVPDEEIFAPALQVHRVRDFDAALGVANATRFGLAAGLLSDDDILWDRFARRIRAGVVNRNRPTTGASSELPFGGLGESGNHRPSAYYAADYCAHPVAMLEAPCVVDQSDGMTGLRAISFPRRCGS